MRLLILAVLVAGCVLAQSAVASDARRGPPLRPYAPRIDQFGFLTDGNRYAAWADSDGLVVLDTATRRRSNFPFPPCAGLLSAVAATALCDGPTLGPTEARLLSLRTGLTRPLPIRPGTTRPPANEFELEVMGRQWAAGRWAPDGRLSGVIFWNWHTGELRTRRMPGLSPTQVDDRHWLEVMRHDLDDRDLTRTRTARYGSAGGYTLRAGPLYRDRPNALILESASGREVLARCAGNLYSASACYDQQIGGGWVHWYDQRRGWLRGLGSRRTLYWPNRWGYRFTAFAHTRHAMLATPPSPRTVYVAWLGERRRK